MLLRTYVLYEYVLEGHVRVGMYVLLSAAVIYRYICIVCVVVLYFFVCVSWFDCFLISINMIVLFDRLVVCLGLSNQYYY